MISRLLFVLIYTEMINYERCATIDGKWGFCVDMMQCTRMADSICKTPVTIVNSVCRPIKVRGFSQVCCSYEDINKPEEISEHLPQPGICAKIEQTSVHYGNASILYDQPWLASISQKRRNNEIISMCVGVLINERYVLTAATCIKYPGITPFSVRLGASDIYKNPNCIKDINGYEQCADPHVDIPIEQIILHPSFVSSYPLNNNIALIRLSHKVTYTEFVKPICLPIKDTLKRSSFEDCFMQSLHNVIGYPKGIKANVVVLSPNLCNIFSKTVISHICARNKDGTEVARCSVSDVIIGLDTSDARNQYYFIAGIASNTFKIEGSEMCGFTRIGLFVDWIQQCLKP